MAIYASLIGNEYAREFKAGFLTIRGNFLKSQTGQRQATQRNRKLASSDEGSIRRKCDGLLAKLDTLCYS